MVNNTTRAINQNTIKRRIMMKKFILFLLISILAIATIACSESKPSTEKPTSENGINIQKPSSENEIREKPQGDPKAVIEEYYTYLESGEYADAYNLLSEELRQDTDLESFSLWNRLLAQTSPETTYVFTLTEEKEEADLDNVGFPYINTFEINKSWFEAYTAEAKTYDTQEYVLAEYNQWKVYRLKEDCNVKAKIASNYNTLGMMYS